MAKKDPTKDAKGRCGTHSGYAAHGRRGEYPCQPCKRANTQYSRDLRARNKTAPAKPSRKKATPAAPVAPVVTAQERDPAPAPAPAPEPAPRVNAPAEQHTDVPDDIPDPPEYLKAKGRKLWVDLTTRYTFTDAALTLAGEACRTVDRLERIAGALSSRSTMWFEVGDIDLADEAGVPVVVNGMIGEARQLQGTLRQTLNQLGVVGVEAANMAPQKSALDQLAERREARLAAAAGGDQ